MWHHQTPDPKMFPPPNQNPADATGGQGRKKPSKYADELQMERVEWRAPTWSELDAVEEIVLTGSGTSG